MEVADPQPKTFQEQAIQATLRTDRKKRFKKSQRWVVVLLMVEDDQQPKSTFPEMVTPETLPTGQPKK
jgi:hypothetical protein